MAGFIWGKAGYRMITRRKPRCCLTCPSPAKEHKALPGVRDRPGPDTGRDGWWDKPRKMIHRVHETVATRTLSRFRCPLGQ